MLRMKTVKAAEIHTAGRLLSPNDTGIKDLVHDISQNGLQVAILVDENMNLIDGFRRLTAMLALDRDDIPVVISDSFEYSLTYLRQRADDPLRREFDARRIWDLHQALTKQRENFTGTSKGQRPDRKIKAPTLRDILPETSRRKNKTRAAMAAVTKRSEHWIQSALFLYGRAEGVIPESEEWLPLAHDLAKRMDEGLNPYTAQGEWHKARGMVRATSTKSQQLLALNGAIHSMSGIMQSLAEIGVIHDGITKEQAAKYAAELRKTRTAIFQTIRRLEERIKR